MATHGALYFQIAFAGFFGLAFVVLFFALGEANSEFDAASGVVQIYRYQGVTCAIHLADEFADFFGVQ